MVRYEIIMAGRGGQGMVLAGIILARAAALYCGYEVVQTQSYGAEARGGPSRSEVIISDEEILYTNVLNPDILVVMSQDALEKYEKIAKSGALIFFESRLVSPPTRIDVKKYGIPAYDIAEKEIGVLLVANMIMLGAMIAVTNIVSKEAVIAAITDMISEKHREINIVALERGIDYAKRYF
ncbi:MAG: 2-oxoacid:acceptor oxidoreductase family protein [Candidatus Baldrarchaeia archaeon]